MKTVFMFLTIAIVLCIFVIIGLLIKIHDIRKKTKYVEEADMWHKLAVTDDLTGVYNRNAYNMYVERHRKSGKNEIKGIMLFDVDDFKMVNDTHGHTVGDIVLKRVGEALLEVFPKPQCRVFRIGGDEFAVLSEDVTEKEIIRRLMLLRKRLDGKEISLSKGYSIIKDNPEKSFRYADEMLYADKLSKKSRSNIK